MLNALAGPGQRPALVSKMPGRTQRINLFTVPDSKVHNGAFFLLFFLLRPSPRLRTPA